MEHRSSSEALVAERRGRFPIGAALTAAALDADPYPHLEALRLQEPVSWVAALGMWYVTRYADVRDVLLDATRFVTGSPDSPVRDTFGRQMLSVDGELHERYRGAAQAAFQPAAIRERLEPAIRTAARRLVDELRPRREAELRAAFARRLPVLTMLAMAGLPASAESRLRGWYDVFGRALANYGLDAAIRAQAQVACAELHAFLDEALAAVTPDGPASLLADLALAAGPARLGDEEIRRNLSIIFFGGISTVDALIVNTLWALARQPAVFERVRADPALLPAAIDEATRWRSPVQSATRHVVADVEFRGVTFRAGETVNCMLGSANRDPDVFDRPDQFDLERPNARRHIAFATGVHACLGFQVARTEARIALEELFAGLPGLAVDLARSAAPHGSEFHQAESLTVAWHGA
jgi:cytochrome P450